MNDSGLMNRPDAAKNTGEDLAAPPEKASQRAETGAERFARHSRKNDRIGTIDPGPNRQVLVERVRHASFAVRIGITRDNVGAGALLTKAEARALAELLIRATTPPRAPLPAEPTTPPVAAPPTEQHRTSPVRRAGIPRGRTSP